jgi:hypothetical protein
VTVAKAELDAVRERVRGDTPFWAERFAKIVTKQGELIPLRFKPGQLELDERLEEQRAAGKPMRALALKARQVGISTYAQSKLTHRGTLLPRYDALTIAHDRETGAKLYRMAETIYVNLPDDDELKPKLGKFRRQREMHFEGEGLWTKGQAFPDSRYLVDTAGEFQAGRGGTYRAVHGSEVAFWPQITVKLSALMAAVPHDPESLIVLESTANGFNEFKHLWDDAEAGRSDFIAFFWPWWREKEYTLGFASETEREAFVVGDPSNPYAADEPDLIELVGAKGQELTLEQLNWRRYTIANISGGDIRLFRQEFPASPEEAFIATGQKVFKRVEQLARRVEETDPKQPTEKNPGPQIGDFKPDRMGTQINRSGDTIEVPESALWMPRERGGPANPNAAPFRLWLPEDEAKARSRDYIVGVDPSGGNTETTKETDYHAIEVIDHKSREQVAEYRSRIEPERLAPLLLLVAMWFNGAWLAIERTGGHGAGLLRILWRDFHYPFVYRSKRTGQTSEKTEHRLGWDTNMRTKPEMVAGMAGLLHEEVDGIKSRALADEVRAYTRTEKGTTEAAPGSFDDLLSAFMIAQQVARELPLRSGFDEGPTESSFVAQTQRLGDYDNRYA